MLKLFKKEKKEVLKPFQWRDKEGIFLTFSEMPTKRLFYTAKMIWNHCQPEHLQMWNDHKYYFSSFYSDEYMFDAFKGAIKELSKRTDIGPRMLEVIKFWVDSSKRSDSKLLITSQDPS